MINAIRDIGYYLRENNGISEEDIVRSLVNKIESNNINEIITIDIKDNGEIITNSEEFYGEITTKALFYQSGNGALGGALRADFFKDEEKEKQKFDKKIKNILTYCEEDKYDEVRKIIYEKIKNQGKDFFAVILKNGRYPY